PCLERAMDRKAQLAASREASGYTSTDPAPPQEVASLSRPSVAVLRAKLLDRSQPMFQRMRAVFSLRNRGGPEAVEALAAAFADPSALLRHELAYVLGQMGDPHAVPFLTEVLRKDGEHVMVRHECAEALGAIGQPESVPVLQQYLKDPNPEVSESCEVALDLIAWVNSKDLHYAS
ncbi:MAG: HEAT repeat domain-containing protein, partial [Thermoplasmatota archaeon]